MLELKKITKVYVTPSFKQKALDEVSISFRDSEFELNPKSWTVY